MITFFVCIKENLSFCDISHSSNDSVATVELCTEIVWQIKHTQLTSDHQLGMLGMCIRIS